MKYNRNQFNLLLERMSNRYSYDESIELKNKQLLTEGFGKGFFNILKNISIKTPQIQRLQNLTGDLNNGISSKNIGELLNTRSADGLIGINSIKNDLKKSGVELNSVEVDGLNNYFKVIAGVDDALQKRGNNSVTSIINRLDDTNLTLKQKEKYVAEIFDDNPKLINIGMSDGSKIINRGDIKGAVSENFVYLSKKNITQFVNTKMSVLRGKKYSVKKMVRHNNFGAGDFLVSHKDYDTYMLLKSADATSQLQTTLKSKGYELIPTDKSSSSFNKKTNKKKSIQVTDADVIKRGILGAKWGLLWKFLGITAIEMTIAGIFWLYECIMLMNNETYNEYDDKNSGLVKDSYTIVKEYELDDCIRVHVEELDTLNPNPRKKMNVDFFDVIIPWGWPVRGGITLISGMSLSFKKTSESLTKIIQSKGEKAVEDALENLTVKEIVNFDCEAKASEIAKNALTSGSEQTIMNDIFTQITGYGGVDSEKLGNAIAAGIETFDNTQEEILKQADMIEIDLGNYNDGVEGKYQMKNYGIGERIRHKCNCKKYFFIYEKLKQLTEEINNGENCKGVIGKLDIYSADGFKDIKNYNNKIFSVSECDVVKKEIEDLEVVWINAGGENVIDITKVAKCSENEITIQKSYASICEEDAVKRGEISKDKTISLPSVTYGLEEPNKDYGWQLDEDLEGDEKIDCGSIQAYWFLTWDNNQSDFVEILEPSEEDGTPKVDWVNSNGKVVFKINEKNINYFETNYPYFCSYGNIYGEKSKEECITEFVAYVNSMPWCFNKFFESN
jgi:hypothetical protein